MRSLGWRGACGGVEVVEAVVCLQGGVDEGVC